MQESRDKVMQKDIFSFFKATISSLVSAGIDLLLFYAICQSSKEWFIILLATVISRCTSASVNFLINKYWTFKSDGKTKKEVIFFFILFVSKMILSAFFVWMLKFIKINQLIIKCFVDTILFFVSYFIQKKFIFNR